MPREVVIVGAGKLGALLHDCLVGDDRWRCAAFHDDASAGATLHGLPILGTGPDAFPPGQLAIIAVGDPGVRRALVTRLAGCGLDWQTYVDRRSIVGGGASLGAGSVVLPFAMIASDVTAGAFCVFNPYSNAGSGAVIGPFTSLLGGASVGGCVIGAECLIGLKSACLDGAVLGERVTVGPMTLVRRAIPDDALVAGNPARIVPRESPGRSISRQPDPLAGR